MVAQTERHTAFNGVTFVYRLGRDVEFAFGHM